MTGMLTGMAHSGVTEAAAIMDPTDALCVRSGVARAVIDRSVGACVVLWACRHLRERGLNDVQVRDLL